MGNAIDKILDELERANVPFTLRNGYLVVPHLAGAEQRKAFATFNDNLHTLRPLVMEDVEASGVWDNGMKGNWEHMDRTHRVNLVYASAVPVDAYCNLAAKKKSYRKFVEDIADSVLFAQYYGALKHAAARQLLLGGCCKVYLILLGGGVFHNKIENILLAIAVAVELLEPEERNALRVCVLDLHQDLTDRFKR